MRTTLALFAALAALSGCSTLHYWLADDTVFPYRVQSAQQIDLEVCYSASNQAEAALANDFVLIDKSPSFRAVRVMERPDYSCDVWIRAWHKQADGAYQVELESLPDFQRVALTVEEPVDHYERDEYPAYIIARAIYDALKPGSDGARMLAEHKRANARADRDRLDLIADEVRRADGLVERGDSRGALDLYVKAVREIKSSQDPSGYHDVAVKMLRTAAKAKPAIPATARDAALRSQALVKQGASGDQAGDEMLKALREAPWWADGWYNTGLLYASDSRDAAYALRMLKVFYDADPSGPRAAIAHQKIIELEAAQMRAGQ